MPLVSIGLPVYNGGQYLDKSIFSILNQTYENYEFIISDNASTDDTENICRSYAGEDHRITYYRNDSNIGAVKNFNILVGIAKGKYFMWVAHDDIHAETFLERCVEVLEKKPSVVLCYTKSKIIDEDGKFVLEYNDNNNLVEKEPHIRVRHLLGNLGLVNALYGVIRTDIIKKTGLIGSYIGSDFNTLLELCILGEFYQVPEYLFFRRDREGNFRNMTLKEKSQILGIIFDSSAKHPQRRRIIEHCKSIYKLEIRHYEKILCLLELVKYIYRLFGKKLESIFNPHQEKTD